MLTGCLRMEFWSYKEFAESICDLKLLLSVEVTIDWLIALAYDPIYYIF
jgi:hypothetical protein